MFTSKLRNMFLFDTDSATMTKTVEEDSIDKELELLDKEIQESENADVELSPNEQLDTLNGTDAKTDDEIEQLKDADNELNVKDDVTKDGKPGEKDGDTLADGKPPEEKLTDTLNGQNSYGVITKDIIKSFPEDQQKTLLRYEGKPISEALKTLIHQKQQIGKLSSRQNIDVKPENPYPDPVKNNEEASKIKEQLIDSRMQRVYPDYPKDEYEWNDLQATDYKKAHRYATERQNMARSIDDAYSSAVYAQSNYHNLNDQAIVESANQIKDSLKSLGLDVKRDFGIDLNNEESINNFMDSLLLDGEKLDINVFETWVNDEDETVLKYGVPIIRKDALLNKFENQYKPHIMLKVKENAFLEGLEAARNTKVAPSFSGSKTTIRKSPSKVAIPNTLEELDRAIEESENSNNY